MPIPPRVRTLELPGQDNGPGILEAVAALSSGALVALPTETVYGLAADAANGDAVARIFAAKGRPRFNPLICHVDGLEMASRYGILDERATRLAEAFWPGPLTIVTPAAADAPVHPLATAGLSSIALRAPRGPARAVIKAFGKAIAAPSANRSGRISPTLARHVMEQLGDAVSLVLDAGSCSVGVESSIVSLLGEAPRLLRPGGLPTEDIEAVLGRPLARNAPDETVIAPGMLASHYAPRLPLRLNATDVRGGEALLAFGEPLTNTASAFAVRNLSPCASLVEAAANLFGYLADLDQSEASGIAVMRIPNRGLGEAINDRLARGASPRSPEPS